MAEYPGEIELDAFFNDSKNQNMLLSLCSFLLAHSRNLWEWEPFTEDNWEVYHQRWLARFNKKIIEFEIPEVEIAVDDNASENFWKHMVSSVRVKKLAELEASDIVGDVLENRSFRALLKPFPQTYTSGWSLPQTESVEPSLRQRYEGEYQLREFVSSWTTNHENTSLSLHRFLKNNEQVMVKWERVMANSWDEYYARWNSRFYLMTKEFHVESTNLANDDNLLKLFWKSFHSLRRVQALAEIEASHVVGHELEHRGIGKAAGRNSEKTRSRYMYIKKAGGDRHKISIPKSLENLLAVATKIMKEEINFVFDAEGVQIHDIEVIDVGETLTVSK